jgi:hypothetical protein
MSLRVKGRIDGAPALIRKLRDLAGRQAKAITRKSANAAIGPVQKGIKANAPAGTPDSTGLLRKSIGRKVKSYAASGAVVALTGPRAGFRRVVTMKRVFFGGNRPFLARQPGPGQTQRTYDPVRYGHFSDRGTRRLKGSFWVSRTWQQQKAAAERAFADKFAAELKKAAGS